MDPQTDPPVVDPTGPTNTAPPEAPASPPAADVMPALATIAGEAPPAMNIANNTTEPPAGSPPPMGNMPSVGRTVHYVLAGDGARKGEHRAAIVTGAWGTATVNLTVFYDQVNDCTPPAPQQHWIGRAWSAGYDESGTTPGTWHWPERV